MTGVKTPGLEGIEKIMRAVEDLRDQVKARNSADSLIAYVQGVGVQVERALRHLRAEAHHYPDGMEE